MLASVCQNRHHEFLSLRLSSLQVLQSFRNACQPAILNLKRMGLDIAILQPMLRQSKQLPAKYPVLGRRRASISSRHRNSVSHNGVSQKPVGTDIPPRVLLAGGDCLERNVVATGGTNGGIAHFHG